jgi:2-amino-4-hydroxy-6-hydroxymethyldihydropteridine diphosphokinase
VQTFRGDIFVILLALGANLPSPAGPPAATLRAALAALADSGITPRAVSRFYVSAAWPDPSDPAFTNAVALVDTELPPRQLLELLHGVEARFGRHRGVRNAPRTLDLDIIDYDGRVEAGPPALPHPRLHERAFVLAPLAEIVPDWRHPVTGLTAVELLAALKAGENDVRVLP